MKLPLRYVVLVFTTIILGDLPVYGQETTASNKPAATEIRPIFSDDFYRDSLTDYQVKGDVAWEKGRLRMAEGSSITRAFEAGSRMKITAELEFPELKKDGDLSLTVLQLDLVGATDCLVAWQQGRAEGKTTGTVSIFDTVLQDGKAILQNMRTAPVSGPLEHGEWFVEYRYGLLQIRYREELVLASFVKKKLATCSGVWWHQYRSSAQLRSLSLRGLRRPPTLSESAQREAVNATKKKSELLKLYGAGKHSEAASLGLSILSVQKRVLGVDHPDYVDTLRYLAELYRNLDDYENAEPLFCKCREISSRVFGESHPTYSFGLTNLAELYRAQGEFGKAEPLYREVRDIVKRVFGELHPSYVSSVGNIGLVHSEQGNFAKAERTLLEARELSRRLNGDESHPGSAAILNNLAVLYTKQGDFEKAEPLARQVCDFVKVTQGKSHPHYIGSLQSLAKVYRGLGKFSESERTLREALDISRQSTISPPFLIAMNLNHLARLYATRGRFEEAEALLLEASVILERVLSKSHPSYGTNLYRLATLYSSQNEFIKAEPLYREALELSRQQIGRNAIGQSQTMQLKFAGTLRGRLDSLLSHSLESSTSDSKLYDEILSWKGMTIVRQRQYRLAGKDAETRPILDSLTVVTRRLSALLRQTPTPKTQKMWRQRLSELSEKRDSLESQLAAASDQFRQASHRLETDELLRLLPPDTVLVDFLSFDYWQRVPKDNYHVLEARRNFLASILKNGQPIEFVNLGPEPNINSAIDTWRTVFLSRDPRVAGQVEPVGRELRNLVWDPLLPYLKGAKTVVLCPDQALGRVAFSALPGRKSGTYLIEDHRLACISVPQLLPALFRESSREQDRANGALLIGDVDYERSTLAAAEFQARLRGAEDLFQDVAFAPLAETAGEIAGIRDLFLEFHEMDSDAVRMLQKQQATESAFRDFAGLYSTLHIATHGFFADPSKKSVQQYAEEEDSRTRSGLFAQNDLSSNYVRGFYPGMLSGLALAGANRAPESEGQDDGILTADEISFLRLEEVDLVVLSACETGLGPVAGGEGLLGVLRQPMKNGQ